MELGGTQIRRQPLGFHIEVKARLIAIDVKLTLEMSLLQ